MQKQPRNTVLKDLCSNGDKYLQSISLKLIRINQNVLNVHFYSTSAMAVDLTKSTHSGSWMKKYLDRELFSIFILLARLRLLLYQK